MNSIGQAELSFTTFYGSASLYVDKAIAYSIPNPSRMLMALCNMHQALLETTRTDRASYPKLTVYLEEFSTGAAFQQDGRIALGRPRFELMLRASERGRVNNTLVHFVGQVAQMLLGFSAENAWPGYLEDLSTIVGLQMANRIRLLPSGNSEMWDDDVDCATLPEFVETFIQSGLRKVARYGKGGLEAALFDLVYNRIASEQPLIAGLHALSDAARAGLSGAPLQNFETFFEAFSISARCDVSAYLRAWQCDVGTLPEKLAHLPPLDTTLPSLRESAEAPTAATSEDEAAKKRALDRKPEASFSRVGVEAITVSVGKEAAVDLLGSAASEATLERLKDVRNEIARETGIVMPGVHLIDDVDLAPYAYAIKVRDEFAGSYVLQKGKCLAIAKPDVLALLTGEDVFEPVYGLAAKWIDSGDIANARASGARVFDPLSVLASHVGQAARDNLWLLLGRQEFAGHFEHVRTKAPALATDLEALLSAYAMHKALRFLLREQVWPRDLVRTFESFYEAAQTKKDPQALAEAARMHLVPAQFGRGKITTMRVAMLDPEFEAACCAADGGVAAFADAAIAAHIKDAIGAIAAEHRLKKVNVLCTAPLRFAFADFALRAKIAARVYAYDEIPSEMQFTSKSVIAAPVT